MGMLSTLITLSIGLVVTLISAHIFLQQSISLAQKIKLSPLIISLIIISLGTNLPEITVAIVSLTHNDPGLSMGNAIGSSIVNITLIFGLVTLLGKVRIGTVKTQKNALILLVIAVLFVGLQFSDILPFRKGLLLLTALLTALTYQFLLGLHGQKFEDKKFVKLAQKITKRQKKTPAIVYISLFVASVAGMGVGGNIFVGSIESLANLLGFSTTLLGLTVTAVATTLPELTTSVLASMKKEDKIIVGTIVGSNIINMTLIPALIFIFGKNGYQVSNELLYLFFVSILLVITLRGFKGRVVAPWVGALFVLLFLGHIVVSFYI